MQYRWDDLRKNVGSQGNPETLLHRYACAVIWDELHNADRVMLNAKDGPTSDVKEGVEQWERGTYLNAVLNCIPDIIGRGVDGKPVRVIEVVVTSERKREDIEKLRAHGVEVIEVLVPNADALMQMVVPDLPDKHNQPYPVGVLKFWPKRVPMSGASKSAQIMRASGIDRRSFRNKADGQIEELITNLHICSPTVRLRFLETMREITELAAALPLSPGNTFLAELDENDG